jgi:hypothetical protein
MAVFRNKVRHYTLFGRRQLILPAQTALIAASPLHTAHRPQRQT